jgi:translation initiation factor IF-3
MYRDLAAQSEWRMPGIPRKFCEVVKIKRRSRKKYVDVPERQRVNEQITAPEVRVIDENNEQLGVLSLRDAINAARERELDLVEVAANAKPPVCKILDYGKFQYLQVKKHRESRKTQKATEIKEIRLRPKTDDYHAGFKIKRARRFLEAGMKVKVRVQFRGREITHPEIGFEQLKEVADALADIAIVEQRPGMEGRTMLMVLAPVTPGA